MSMTCNPKNTLLFSWCLALCALFGGPAAQAAGTAFLSVTTINCPNTANGGAATCTNTLVRATGGSITIGNPAVTLSDNTDFVQLTTVTNACVPGKVVTTSNNCTLTFNTTPKHAGASSSTFTVNAPGSPQGTLNENAIGMSMQTSLTCGATAGQNILCGGDQQVWPMNGNITLPVNPLSINGDASLTVGGLYCSTASGYVLVGSAVYTVTSSNWCYFDVGFAPTSAGVKTATITLRTVSDGTQTMVITATATASSLAANTNSIACPASSVGTSANCSTITLTASGGVTLGAVPFSHTDGTDFSLPLGTCTANATLSSAQSCTTGALMFTPHQTGPLSDTITVSSNATGSPVITASGTATNSYSYSWNVGNYGACTGGQGAWNYSPWTPTCGIGPTQQSRNGSCNVIADSGIETAVLSCLRSDGVTVDASLCTDPMPSNSRSCTPTAGFSCGSEAPLSQTQVLATRCSGGCVPDRSHGVFCVLAPF